VVVLEIMNQDTTNCFICLEPVLEEDLNLYSRLCVCSLQVHLSCLLIWTRKGKELECSACKKPFIGVDIPDDEKESSDEFQDSLASFYRSEDSESSSSHDFISNNEEILPYLDDSLVQLNQIGLWQVYKKLSLQSISTLWRLKHRLEPRAHHSWAIGSILDNAANDTYYNWNYVAWVFRIPSVITNLTVFYYMEHQIQRPVETQDVICLRKGLLTTFFSAIGLNMVLGLLLCCFVSSMWINVAAFWTINFCFMQWREEQLGGISCFRAARAWICEMIGRRLLAAHAAVLIRIHVDISSLN
jgi:hypothetical protein